MIKATRCFVYEGKEVHAVGDCIVKDGTFTSSQLQRLISLGLVKEVPEEQFPPEIKPPKPTPKPTHEPVSYEDELEFEALEEPEVEEVAIVKKIKQSSKRSSFDRIP